MITALVLARRGLGRVSPNPAVGCVLVRQDLGGRIVGRGWTQPGGRPHAETEAIRRAGALSAGATAYITLEPCNHTGETGPCAEALIKAGIKCAVVAIKDPDPRTAGGGLKRLSDAGIEVITDVMADEAGYLNAGFISKVIHKRPIFTWKAATSLDGRIATQSGDSKWITGEKARQYGHLLRAQHDAIMIGSETALHDDPSLACRLPGMADRSPIRIVLSSRLRISTSSQLVKTASDIPTLIYTLDTDLDRRGALEATGVTVKTARSDENGRISIPDVAADLAQQGLTRVLLEGGGTLAASFLTADLINRIYWFTAGKLIGSEGRPALGETNIDRLIQSPAFTRRSICVMGPDILNIMERDRGA
jgi:diaminohydroxyphosphoribosylaminopyrimidine deaminase / 5-amino-6-(5-phosphoribosylamino)uracil reductase